MGKMGQVSLQNTDKEGSSVDSSKEGSSARSSARSSACSSTDSKEDSMEGINKVDSGKVDTAVGGS